MKYNMNPNFSLRPVTTDDISKVVEIEQRVQVSAWTESHFSAELTKPYSHFLLLTDDETDQDVAGYIVFWTLFDECQILNIAVDLPYRGLGFAKKMIRKAVAIAVSKGLNKITLDVRKSNLSAIQLYQGMNFTITHIRKGFYSNGEDAYQMTLHLQEELIQF